MSDSQQVCFTCPVPLIKQVEEVAALSGRSRSSTLAQLIRVALDAKFPSHVEAEGNSGSGKGATVEIFKAIAKSEP